MMSLEHDETFQVNTGKRVTDDPLVRSGTNNGHHTRKTPGRYLNEEPAIKRRRRRRRRLNPRFVIMVSVLLVLLIGIAVGIVSCCAKPKILGRWNLDGTTVYEFNKHGKGALVLMTAQYDFTYKIEDDVIYIDFIDERALDSRYTFKVNGTMLFMTGGPGDSRGEFILNREK